MSTIDLAKYSQTPNFVAQEDFSLILGRMLNRLTQLLPSYDALVESDPGYQILAVAAHELSALRSEVANQAKSVLLPTATGEALDYLAARFNIQRAVITAANPNASPPTPAIYESDDSLRSRTLSALAAMSTAGSHESYRFWSLSAHADIAKVKVISPSQNQIEIYTQIRTGGDSAAALQALQDLLNPANLAKANKRPIGDQITIALASPILYDIEVALTYPAVPDSALAQAEAEAKLAAYVGSVAIGQAVSQEMIISQLGIEGVSDIELISPTADVLINPNEIAVCNSITVEVAND